MNTVVLHVTKREIFGKKVKKLRKEGILPANIYGKNITSTAVQLPIGEFEKVYKEVGETGLVELDLNGEKKPVLIHDVAFDYMAQQTLHADFYQVNLKEKVKTMVPVVLNGEPVAVTEKVGLLLQTLSEVEIEALPADLPDHIEADVTRLATLDESITVGDLQSPKGTTILTDASQVIAKISELVSKEAQEQAQAEEAASAEAKAETQGETVPETTTPTENTESAKE